MSFLGRRLRAPGAHAHHDRLFSVPCILAVGRAACEQLLPHFRTRPWAPCGLPFFLEFGFATFAGSLAVFPPNSPLFRSTWLMGPQGWSQGYGQVFRNCWALLPCPLERKPDENKAAEGRAFHSERELLKSHLNSLHFSCKCK